MVAGLLMMGGDKLPGSDESSLVRLPPGQVVASSWTWSSDSIRSWVAMAATQGRASAPLQRPSGWTGAAPIWSTVVIEGDIPTASVNFELFFYNKLSLVSSPGCCQFGGYGSVVLNNGFECGVAEISTHAGGHFFPFPHFSAHHVVVRAAHCCWTEDEVQRLMVVEMSLMSRMNCLVNHLPDDTPKLNMISNYGFTNLALHQIYMDVFESGLNLTMVSFSCYHDFCYIGACSSYVLYGQKSGCYALLLLQTIGHVDYVSLLFGTCRRRVRASLLRFLRFNGKEPPDLSSVMHPRDLQLSPLPHRHLPTRLLVEPLALRLVRLQEALEEYNCRFVASEFSTDPLVGSCCALRHKLHVSPIVFSVCIQLDMLVSWDDCCNHVVVICFYLMK